MASVKYVILQFFSEYLIFVHTKDTMIVDVKLSTIKKKGPSNSPTVWDL